MDSTGIWDPSQLHPAVRMSSGLYSIFHSTSRGHRWDVAYPQVQEIKYFYASQIFPTETMVDIFKKVQRNISGEKTPWNLQFFERL